MKDDPCSYCRTPLEEQQSSQIPPSPVCQGCPLGTLHSSAGKGAAIPPFALTAVLTAALLA